jgi:hypothetical protein
LWFVGFWAFGLGPEFTRRPKYVQIKESGVVFYPIQQHD